MLARKEKCTACIAWIYLTWVRILSAGAVSGRCVERDVLFQQIHIPYWNKKSREQNVAKSRNIFARQSIPATFCSNKVRNFLLFQEWSKLPHFHTFLPFRYTGKMYFRVSSVTMDTFPDNFQTIYTLFFIRKSFIRKY